LSNAWGFRKHESDVVLEACLELEINAGWFLTEHEDGILAV